MPVGDGAHHGAHGEAVEVVVDEDQHAQSEGRQLRAHPGVDVLLRPAAEGGGAAGGVDQGHDDAQEHQEEEDAGVVRDGGHEAVVDDHVQRGHGGELAGEKGAHQHADEEGAVGFLGDEGQGDGDDGGDQGPEGAVHAVGGFGALLRREGGDAQQHGGQGHQRRDAEQTMVSQGSHRGFSFPQLKKWSHDFPP